jgi:F420-dependent oxidoreductase-like protein
MRIGVHLVRFDVAGGTGAIGPAIAAFGRAVDTAGIDNVSCMDHYFQIGVIGPPEQAMLEGYTTLGFLAGVTHRAELQLLVTGVSYRHPGLLAKIVTTLDVLSGGRAVLGIGAAWNEEEHRGLGVPLPSVAERFERLEETLQIVRQMWRGDESPYAGTHYQLERPLNQPPPVRMPPIMVGGGGERKTLRLVAKYADACNLFANPSSGPAGITHKLGVLRSHCEREGTDFDAIRKTILWGAPIDPGVSGTEFVEHMRGFAALGVEEVHVMHFGTEPVAFVQGLGDHVVGPLHALG